MKKKRISLPFGHTQIVHFIGGYKRTITDVEIIWENEMTHIMTTKGVEWIINKNNVLCTEIIPRDFNQNNEK